MRTKPSVISEEQHLARVAAPKQVNYMIDNKIRKEKSPSSSPRDRQQIYNVKKKGMLHLRQEILERYLSLIFQSLWQPWIMRDL